MIDLRSLPCLVVGGGNVALRKVQSLLEFKAKVTVVSPRISKVLDILSTRGEITVLRKSYSAECIKGQKIVFSATDNPQVNMMVSSDCKRAGILLNAADNPALCDFILPAVLRRGCLTISVSSQGKAPFFAKDIKRKLSEMMPSGAGYISELAADFRKHLLSDSNGLTQKKKERAYRSFLKTDWDKVLAGEGKGRSRRILREILKEVYRT